MKAAETWSPGAEAPHAPVPGEEKLLRIRRSGPGFSKELADAVAVEEPLEIRVVHGPDERRETCSLSVTMRTPGHDLDLAAGFLLTEGILERREQIRALDHCDPPAKGGPKGNVVSVEVDPDVDLDLARLERHFYATSSCGVCGKTSIDALFVQGIETLAPGLFVRGSLIHQLPARMRAEQRIFERTGSVHAAGLFDADGTLRCLREDVGRHNACDKVIGNQLMAGLNPLGDTLMAVSGRASFEIVQKALVAGIPVMVAVGAPSSLAVDMALRFDMTLVGFASAESFNVYAGDHRVGFGS